MEVGGKFTVTVTHARKQERELEVVTSRWREAPEGDKLAKRPTGHVITGLLQFEILFRIITERTNDVSMDISERFSLWKEHSKYESVRHQKRPLREQ